MADEAWLRHLSVARFQGGAWIHPDPESVTALARQRLGRAISELMDLAQDYTEAFNDVARGRRSMRALPLVPAPGNGALGVNAVEAGFLLLLGRCQITVEYRPPALEVTLVTVAGFQRQARPLHRLTPEADAFGSLAWRLDDSLILTPDLIIKKLFEDITRAAAEAGDLG